MITPVRETAFNLRRRSRAVLDGLLSIGADLEALHLPAMPDTPLHEGARRAGLRVVPEIYPGLVYDDQGGVGVKRIYEGDPEEEAGLIRHWLRHGRIVTDSGKELDFHAESIEVHGDMSNAVEIITAIRRAVAGEGVEIGPALGSE